MNDNTIIGPWANDQMKLWAKKVALCGDAGFMDSDEMRLIKAAPEMMDIMQFYPALEVAALLLESIGLDILDDKKSQIRLGRVVATLKILAKRAKEATSQIEG